MNAKTLAITQQSLRDAGVLVFNETDEVADILFALEAGINRLLPDMPLFMQTMYRLDIAEALVHKALQHQHPAQQLAEIIFRRQWEKAISRLDTPPIAPEADTDLLL